MAMEGEASSLPSGLLGLRRDDLIGRTEEDARALIGDLGGQAFVSNDGFIPASYEPSRICLRVDRGRVVDASSLLWKGCPST